MVETPFAPEPQEPMRDKPQTRPAWRDFDPEPPPEDVLSRHGALVLDPLTAVRLPGEPLPRQTVYLAGSLIIPESVLTDGDAMGLLDRALAEENVSFDRDRAFEELRQLRGVPNPGVAVALLPAGGTEPTFAPDAWSVLQRARGHANAANSRELLAGLGLNHLLVAGSHIEGHPISGMSHIEGHPVFDSYGIAEYVLAGSGGRAPVTWVGKEPDRCQEVKGRRPLVAILDTGCGDHPWLRAGVTKTAVYNGLHAELTDPTTDPEITGDLVGPMDGFLDSHSGHGTFIAGLIRQISPDSDILALRIMSSDGVVQEGDLLQALSVLNGLVRKARDGDADGLEIDVVSLSLGYYHEAPEDSDLDPLLLRQVESLAALGVSVVACAGNDATTRQMYPAAFAPHPGGQAQPNASILPVLSVGALNPDGSTALFSNGGDWVRTWEAGAAVVSTFPITFDGGGQPSVSVPTPHGRPRRTIDPDSFRGGFGTWSGTSFSTPILAARLARHLEGALMQAAAGSTVPECLDRGWQAITAETGLRRPE